MYVCMYVCMRTHYRNVHVPCVQYIYTLHVCVQYICIGIHNIGKGCKSPNH